MNAIRIEINVNEDLLHSHAYMYTCIMSYMYAHIILCK